MTLLRTPTAEVIEQLGIEVPILCGAMMAILDATEEDIVLTERLTGVPVSVIRTPYIEKLGTKAGPIGRWMLKGRKTKHWMRMIYSLQSLWKLKRSSVRSFSYKDYLQAGRSVEGIEEILPVAEVVRRFRAAGAGVGDPKDRKAAVP